MSAPYAPIESVELDWRDSHYAMVEHFGMPDFAATQPGELSLVPIEDPADTFAAEVRRAEGPRRGQARNHDWSLSEGGQ